MVSLEGRGVVTMTLLVCVYVPNGIILAGDSRTTLTKTNEISDATGKKMAETEKIVLSDTMYKVIKLSKVEVGIACYDSAYIDNNPIEFHIRSFEESEVNKDDDVEKIVKKLKKYFEGNFPGIPVGFFIAGFTKVDAKSIPHVFLYHTTKEINPKRANINQGKVVFGILRGGDTLIVDRLIDPKFLPAFQAMTIQDAIDYAIYLIGTTIDTLKFEPRYTSVGGPIDVLLIEPENIKFIQRKGYHGE
jgi:hypothetical protein